MTDLRILYVITKRDYRNLYFDFFKANKIPTVVSEIGEGTSVARTMDLFSIENVKKVLFQITLEKDEVKPLLYKLKREMRLGDSGNGVAFTVPIENIGGISSLKYLYGDKPYTKKENSMENLNFKYSVINIIVNTGFVDTVMEAAKSVGAKGGTVLKARGTQNDLTKFFGIQISEEKQLIYIVCNSEDTKTIMQAIMEKAGPKTDARGFLFSVPVEEIEGLQSLMKEE